MLFKSDVIRKALSEDGNILTPNLNQQTQDVLRRGPSVENADAIGIGLGMGVIGVGFALKSLYELVTQE